jgi:DNA modification methylase
MPNLARHIQDLTNSEQLPIPDDPIDYSIPYRARIKGASRHYGFFPFFAKKPWPVVQAYINYYTSPGDLVGDAFSGSGVTPVEALVLGRRAVSTDINPVARFITRMTAVAPVNLDDLRAAYIQVRDTARTRIESLDSMSEADLIYLLSTLDYPRNPIPDTVRRAGAASVDQLHTPRQLAALTILRDAINQIADPLLRDLLLVVLARTIRYANRTYNVPGGGGSKIPRTPYRGDAGIFLRYSYSFAKNFYEHSVWPTFERNFQNVLRAKEETNRLIGGRYNDQNFILGDVPASRIHELTGDEKVDYFFTDPPYSNEIHFVDLSTLWAAWLGLEITEQTRHDELMIRDRKRESRRRFEQEFAASVQSIARALKQDRWFTLVYKHRDLSLWQNIVAACEQAGLRYINAVWQDLNVVSKRQLENPNINPKGDMYLNFRKMSPQKFKAAYPRAAVLDIPTRPMYVQREIERLIVSYLGADTQLITAGVIQQILDSRAFRNYTENPANLTQDIKAELDKSHFSTWKPGQWIITPGEPVDTSLWPIDRARYYIFEFLRERGEATEGQVSEYLLTRWAEEHSGSTELVTIDVRALLRHVGTEVDSSRVWRFDEERVTKYKQLRLFFQRSKADEIRESIEEREVSQEQPLQPDYEGIALLLDRLRDANTENTGFKAQARKLLEILNSMLHNLQDYREGLIEQVRAVGEWAEFGIDLRNIPFEDVVVQIVLRSEDRPFDLYREIAQKVFGSLDDGDFLVQFRLVTLSEWVHAVEIAQLRQREDELGITLLARK